jgi:hypothetical protein
VLPSTFCCWSLPSTKNTNICWAIEIVVCKALKLLDLENVHLLFDELIQRASNCVSNPSGGSTGSNSRKIGYSNGSSSTVSTNFSKNLASGSGSKSGFDK